MSHRVIAAVALLTGILVIAGLAARPGAGAAEKPKLVIAVQPTATPETLAAEARELERFLSERTGADVKVMFPTTFAGVIEALRFGHADAAFMSAWPAALAQKRANAELVLAEIREVIVDGKKVEAPSYYSYWVVLKGSPYRTLGELQGKRAALPNPLSTSGYVAPVARMVEVGLLKRPAGTNEVDPRQFFGEVHFAGGYGQGWQALKSGQVDVTVIAGDVPEKLYREVLDATRIVEQQGPVPSHAVLFSKSLRDPLRGKLQEALLALGAAAHRPLMRKFISGIFVSFKPTTLEEHLGPLNRYLTTTNFQFVERLR